MSKRRQEGFAAKSPLEGKGERHEQGKGGDGGRGHGATERERAKGEEHGGVGRHFAGGGEFQRAFPEDGGNPEVRGQTKRAPFAQSRADGQGPTGS